MKSDEVGCCIIALYSAKRVYQLTQISRESATPYCYDHPQFRAQKIDPPNLHMGSRDPCAKLRSFQPRSRRRPRRSGRRSTPSLYRPLDGVSRKHYENRVDVQNAMRIQKTDRRARIWENLKEATGQNTVSGALDAASLYYLKMRGSEAYRTGAVTKLM